MGAVEDEDPVDQMQESFGSVGEARQWKQSCKRRQYGLVPRLGRLLTPEPIAADAQTLHRVSSVQMPLLLPNLDKLAPTGPPSALKTLYDSRLERSV